MITKMLSIVNTRKLAKFGLPSAMRALSAPIHIEAKIKSMGLDLPATPEAPKGNYMSYSRSGNLIFLSGTLPKPADGDMICGRLGDDMTVEDGQHAAKIAGLQMLSTLIAAVGDLDRVKRVVNIKGFINSTATFTDQPLVLNGCSDLMGDVFGVDIGRHSRSALGTNTLPLGVAVEIEGTFEVKDEGEA